MLNLLAVTKMNIISKKEALVKGLKKYFTGISCKNGHIAEKYIRSGKCILCIKERGKKYYKTNKEQRSKYGKSHYIKHKKDIIARNKKYRKNNPDKIREQKRKAKGFPAPTRPMPEFCETDCGRKATCLDHDHITGKFRGWLCHPCNMAIGQLGDTAERINQVLLYLK